MPLVYHSPKTASLAKMSICASEEAVELIKTKLATTNPSPSIAMMSCLSEKTDEHHHLIAADAINNKKQQRHYNYPTAMSFDQISSSPISIESTITAKPVITFREITHYSVKISWHLESASKTDLMNSRNSVDLLMAEQPDYNNARFTLFFDIPGDSERFRMLYFGQKNRVKITGLRRSTIYRLFLRASLDPRSKDIGTFAAFATSPEPRLLDDGIMNDSRHMKGWLAYANPKERDDAVLAIPSFRCAMWCRRYCSVIPDPMQMKLDAEYAWQHYKWTAKENGWSEVKHHYFKGIVTQNVQQAKFNERDMCNLDLQEFCQDEDFHTTIKEAQKSAICWRSAECIPCNIGALHLCQSSSLIYWLSCDICGSDYIGMTPPGVTLSESLTGQHPWIRGHFRECHPEMWNVNNEDDGDACFSLSNEEIIGFYDHVTCIVIQLCDPKRHHETVRTIQKLIRQLRPTDNDLYH